MTDMENGAAERSQIEEENKILEIQEVRVFEDLTKDQIIKKLNRLY